LGLIGFVFSSGAGVVYFHNPLRHRELHWFCRCENWVCFAQLTHEFVASWAGWAGRAEDRRQETGDRMRFGDELPACRDMRCVSAVLRR